MRSKGKSTNAKPLDSAVADSKSAITDSPNRSANSDRLVEGMSVNIGKVIKKFEEIKKVTPKQVAKGAKIPYSTLMEYRIGGKKWSIRPT